jgi:hypothetical protein
MTLLSELIDIPHEVHKSDFVISLKSAIEQPERTIADYVVTPQLAECFDMALSLITSSVADAKSKSSYLHASFGAGKSAFMAVLHLLLRGEPAARAKPELAPLLAKYDDRLANRKFLLVPYQAVGADSLEQVVLGDYVEYVRLLHPEAPLPAVYLSDGMLADAELKRTELGDEVFFRILSEGDVDDDWGDLGADWTGERFEKALEAPPTSSERDQLVSALLRSHYRALPGQAQTTAHGFVPIDDGLEAISRHAHALGYDAVVLFLDELMLWLDSRMSDLKFVSREGSKIVKLVEGDQAKRPSPIVGFIAKQRDLRELVGPNVPGLSAQTAVDVFSHSAGRFDTITLEDRNLAAIAEQRLLRPRSEAARHQIDDAFEIVKRQLDERGERDVLLTDTGDLAAFRRLYPFSPALVDALVALSGAMQRERTALKVMLQLLVDNRDRLQVGQLVPLGDLFDAINRPDEQPLTEAMRAQFKQASGMWSQRFNPMLLRTHDLSPEAAALVPVEHQYVTDSRLAKSLLVAALVPEVGPLRALTVSRLTALNAGVVRAFIPGAERQQVLDRLRTWAAEIGELRLGEDDHDPTVSVQLLGIDTAPIVDAARVVDNDGERRRRLRDLLIDMLEMKGGDSLSPQLELIWRGTPRSVDVVFANVRNVDELPDESFRAGTNPKLVIDFPWDTGEFRPSDDRARVDTYRRDRPAEWTAVWLPNFLSAASQTLLGKLVRLDYILTGETFERLAGHLSPSDRPLARAQLANEQAATLERVRAIVRQAYAIEQPQTGAVDSQLQPGDQFISLDPALNLRPPTGTSMRDYSTGVADQLFGYRYPKHPDFTDKIATADLRHTLTHVTAALGQPNGRLENVEATMRRVLTKVAGPLRLGTMHAAHFVVDLQHWLDLVERRRAETGTVTLTVRMMRSWLDGADTPADRRGLTTDVADLVILSVAVATDRSFVDSGKPVAKPDIGRLGLDWELRSEELPTDEVWAEALRRADHVGIVAASSLRSAAAVADLNEKIHSELVGDRGEHVRELAKALGRLSGVVELPDDCPRRRTAEAAAVLVQRLHATPDRAVSVLAQLEVPSTVAAIGTSIKQAASVRTAVQSCNVELLAQATALGSEFAPEAQLIKSRLQEAVQADESTIALVTRLHEAEKAATQLMTKAATSRIATTASGGDATVVQTGSIAADAADAGSTSASVSVRDQAEVHLTEMRQRLRAAGLRLTWSIESIEGTDAGS